MGHPSDWDPIAAALAEFATHSLEIRAAADWQTGIQQLTEAMPTRSIVVGYSMGARIALGVAMEAAQRCDALVLVSGNPGLESEQAREQRRQSDQRLCQQIESEPRESFLNQWYQQDVFASTPETIRRQQVEQKLNRTSSDWPAILRSWSVSQQPNYWPRLRELQMPVLIVAGEDDEKYRKIAIRFQKEGPSENVTIKIVPDCGHIVHRERPEAVVQIVRDFVSLVGSS